MILISLLDVIVPKNKNNILFYSTPDVSHNSLALFIIMANNQFNKNINYIWLTNLKTNHSLFKEYLKSKMNLDQNSIKFFKKKSFIGIYTYLRSKFIFRTHGLYVGATIPKNKIVINLWHGMPMKNIDMQLNTGANQLDKFTYIIATSRFFINIFTSTFKIKHNQIKIFKQPVTEYFFKLKKTDLMLESLFNLKRINKVFIWMPTWRIPNQKYSIMPKNITRKVDLIPLVKSFKELKFINKLLKKNNNYLIIKFHASDKELSINQNDLSNIILINDEIMVKKNLNIYEILPYTDILISDYSSIVIDYMLLKKPIVSVINKEENYLLDIDNEMFNDVYLQENRIYTFKKLCDLFSLKIKPKKLSKKIITKYNEIDARSINEILKITEV